MKLPLQSLALWCGVLLSANSFAQVPAAKSSAPSSAPSSSIAPVSPAVPAPTISKSTKLANTLPTTPAAGGGEGKVWVNSASKTYHCAGTKYYGKTKAGEYMTEADAKAKGNHPNHKKVCA